MCLFYVDTKSIEQCVIICNIHFHQSLIFISVITSHIHQKHYSVNSVTRVVKRSLKIRSLIYKLEIKIHFSSIRY